MNNFTNEQHPINIEMPVIMRVISENMYSSDIVFVRENVQNAVDAIRIRQSRTSQIVSKEELKIEVRIHTDYIEIEDWGIGMSQKDLIDYYWTLGKSSKKTDEAKNAGCIGQFGIGGFASFGVCSELHIHTSISENDKDKIHSFLYKSDLQNVLPQATYNQSNRITHRGTLVRCIPEHKFDVKTITQYLKLYVRHLPEKVYINGILLSGVPFQDSTITSLDNFTVSKNFDGNLISGYIQNYSDKVTFQATEICIENEKYLLNGEVGLLVNINHKKRQTNQLVGISEDLDENILVYKNNFLISNFIYQKVPLVGKLNLPFVMPIATREGFEEQTNLMLRKVFHAISELLIDYICQHSNLLAKYINLIARHIYDNENIEQIMNLPVTLADSKKATLKQLKDNFHNKQKVYYVLDNANENTNENARTIQYRGSSVVIISTNERPLRYIITNFLQRHCDAQEVPNIVVEKVIPSSEIDGNSRYIITRIEKALDEQRCHQIQVKGCQLSPKDSVVWLDISEKILYVDIFHYDFQSLTQITNYNALDAFVDAFLREYAEDSLAKYRTKIFGKRGKGLVFVVNKDKYQVDLERISPLSLSKGKNSSWNGPTENLIKITSQDFKNMEGLFLRLPEGLVESYNEYISEEHQIEVVSLGKTIFLILYSDIDSSLILNLDLDRHAFNIEDNDGNHGYHQKIDKQHIQQYKKVNSTYVPIPEEFESSLDPKGVKKTIYIGCRAE
jgi:hypothetical protein